MNLFDIFINRSPLQKAIRLENLRAELEQQGFTVVRTDWLYRLNEAIRKRNLEEA
jgi:hypothetical protein